MNATDRFEQIQTLLLRFPLASLGAAPDGLSRDEPHAPGRSPNCSRPLCVCVFWCVCACMLNNVRICICRTLPARHDRSPHREDEEDVEEEEEEGLTDDADAFGVGSGEEFEANAASR
jgi:hypothetical protein